VSGQQAAELEPLPPGYVIVFFLVCNSEIVALWLVPAFTISLITVIHCVEKNTFVTTYLALAVKKTFIVAAFRPCYVGRLSAVGCAYKNSTFIVELTFSYIAVIYARYLSCAVTAQ